jgi:hypothetical protein
MSGILRRELFDGDMPLHPGQMCPETAVHPSAKREVPVA